MSHVFISASALVVSLIVCFKDSQAQSSDRYSSVPSDLATAAVIQGKIHRIRPKSLPVFPVSKVEHFQRFERFALVGIVLTLPGTAL